MASAELDQLGAQRQLQERLSLMQTVRLHHSAISEPSEKRVRVTALVRSDHVQLSVSACPA